MSRLVVFLFFAFVVACVVALPTRTPQTQVPSRIIRAAAAAAEPARLNRGYGGYGHHGYYGHGHGGFRGHGHGGFGGHGHGFRYGHGHHGGFGGYHHRGFGHG